MARTARLDRLLLGLHRQFGFQHWWPARTPFEVMVGAVLTQHTSWRQVERAIERLRAEDLLAPRRLLAAGREKLERAVRPAGTYRIKAGRLLALCESYERLGGLDFLREAPLARAREALLGVWGIGPETADAILCYAAARPTVVVDVYARRLLARHGMHAAARLPYADLRRWLGERLLEDAWVHQEFHALCVRAGRAQGRPKTPRERERRQPLRPADGTRTQSKLTSNPTAASGSAAWR